MTAPFFCPSAGFEQTCGSDAYVRLIVKVILVIFTRASAQQAAPMGTEAAADAVVAVAMRWKKFQTMAISLCLCLSPSFFLSFFLSFSLSLSLFLSLSLSLSLSFLKVSY